MKWLFSSVRYFTPCNDVSEPNSLHTSLAEPNLFRTLFPNIFILVTSDELATIMANLYVYPTNCFVSSLPETF